jgi:predicted CoA-substrate-specific enzyme activase
MDLTINDVANLPETASPQPLSSRCSVFMKSDCTHKLNKGEATKPDIVLSLSDVMATKVADFLKRAKINTGKVLLSGGVTKNKYLVKYVKEKLPNVEFIIPEEAPYFEAYGAAILAAKAGSSLPEFENMFKDHEIGFSRYPSLKTAEGRVTYLESKRGKVKAGGEYIMGVDGGSTTTKVALIDIETEEIVAEHYGRTHGDPVDSLKKCLIEVKKQIKEQIGDEKITISLAATTGSSREILGVFLETPAVYNEIIAHAVGTTYFKPDIDTLFEIGGQDAKYVSLKNKVPIDYAMNEACSAGTGSFLEESASGDLNITNVEDIGPIALNAQAPLKFGEHCSAFINSDIRKAIQWGASREDITAGIITSIVSNYLNRVVGNRNIGQNVVLQGGVAKNPGVPLAFAMLMDKDIVIPPDPELLGCFGVGILAKQKEEDGFIDKQIFDIDVILNSEIIHERDFICKACDNLCSVRVLNVNGNKYMFGGRCNKYANARKKKNFDEKKIFNYIEERENLLFNVFGAPADTLVKKKDYVVGIPKAFSVYTLWPLYSWFFHTLGVKVRLSDDISHEGIARMESAYCFPAEIAHGAVQNSVDRNDDFIFTPHFRDMESYEKDVHANFCPITQSLPYYIKKAFPEIDDDKFLSPVVSFKFGLDKALEGFLTMGEQLGISDKEIKKAFLVGVEKQNEFLTANQKLGEEALAKAREADHPVIAVLGRPYNAFTKDANMGIPLKFTSRGYSVLPFDMLPFEGIDIFSNMYWYYGQQDMKAANFLKTEDNIFVTYITNFSCAPDSFMLHYMKWIMGTKPFLILELDSHSADAGIDTRVEAYLDIIEGYKSKFTEEKEERYDNGLRFINNGKDELHVMDVHKNERIEIFGNKKIKMLLSSMGRLSSELLAASVRGIGINAEAMPVPDSFTLQMARNYMSGKECLPSQLVLGSALKYFASDDYDRDTTYLLFVPTTTGPCRTGQYFVFYENLFKDLELDNVVVVSLDSDNSYLELGPTFSQQAWWGLSVADHMKDIETTLRAIAVDPVAAIAKYDELWQDLIEIAEKDMSKLIPSLKQIASELAKIPLKKKMEDAPKILVVGEIYVRRDDFAVDELVRLMSKKGIIAKVSGIGEWLYYCDYSRRYEIKKRYDLLPWYKKLFSQEMRDLITWKIEEIWKHNVDKKVGNALAEANLIPHAPHDMTKIMDNANTTFVTNELESEISISSGVAATALEEDYSGVVNISPFACLIGRVIEGILTPWARERKLPIMSVEIDGDVLPPSIVNKLEIFMLNVLRFRKDFEDSELVDRIDIEDQSFTRRIIK